MKEKKGHERKTAGPKKETGPSKKKRAEREFDGILERGPEISAEIEQMEEGTFGSLEEYTAQERLLIFQNELLNRVRQTNEYKESLQRVAADFDNFRKRTEKERESFVKYANERLILRFLDVLDNLDRAMENGKEIEDEDPFFSGIQLIHSQFLKIMSDEGVMAIDETGVVFDPYKHDAMMQIIDNELKENSVADVFQKGYFLKDKVIRPAKVRISKRDDNIDAMNENRKADTDK